MLRQVFVWLRSKVSLAATRQQSAAFYQWTAPSSVSCFIIMRIGTLRCYYVIVVSIPDTVIVIPPTHSQRKNKLQHSTLSWAVRCSLQTTWWKQLVNAADSGAIYNRWRWGGSPLMKLIKTGQIITHTEQSVSRKEHFLLSALRLQKPPAWNPQK